MKESRPRDGLVFALATGLVLTGAFSGRGVTTADGAEVVSEALEILITGSPAPMPPGGAQALQAFPAGARPSKYGLFPSLLPLPFAAAVWPLRRSLSSSGLDAAVSLTWAVGAGLCAMAFLSLVRRLKPSASPLWGPAFLAGTFLWPYAADSFVEPWAAAALAFAASKLLEDPVVSPRAGWAGGSLWAGACLLKPVLWLTVPLALLVIALGRDGSRGRLRSIAAFILPVSAGLALVLAVNLFRQGSLLEFGYGDEAGLFTTNLLDGLQGLLASPGRSVLLFAPITLGALCVLHRLSLPARLLLVGVPCLHLLVVARWWGWNGGSAWGPRHLLPVLPLLAAPAVLLPGAAAGTLIGLGVLINVSGVLVAPGAWISWVETLQVPLAAGWPPKGSERVSEVPCLIPVRGHLWLLARASGSAAPVPCASEGATETVRPPPAAVAVTPLIVRSLAGLPPLAPTIPRVLVRMASGHSARGEQSLALLIAREALRSAPDDPAARALFGLTPPGSAR